MAASVSAVLQNRAIDHAHDLQRYKQTVSARLVATLNRADASIANELAQALLTMDADKFTVERLDRLLKSVRDLNGKVYDSVFDQLRSEMSDFAEYESKFQLENLSSVLPKPVSVLFPVAAVNADQVYAAALSRPFQGRLLSGWAKNVEDSRLTIIRNTVRAGYVEGRTTDQIIRSIRGTRALRYTDGVLDRPRRELAAVVQTALSHTAQTARQSFVDANADLIKAVKWTATLDNKTSEQCRIRDGKQYTADSSHKPIGHAIPWLGGPGRLHFNCRSVDTPVTKSWKELGIDAKELPAGDRASMDGLVPADTTYAEWIKSQPAGRQDEILGPERAQLLRQGKVSFEQFYNDKGKFLTLQDLRAKLAS